MLQSLKGVRLGLFVFLGTVFLVIAIFLIGSKDFLFQETFTVKTYFPTVEGIRVGTSVRLSGINVGSVSNIKISDDPTGKVEVTMKINSEVRKFIRLNTMATIQTEGLVGNKVIILLIGKGDAPIVKEGDFILSKPQIDFGQIIEETQVMLGYLNEITKNFADISKTINEGKGTLGKVINDDKLYLASTNLVVESQKSLNTITGRIEEFSQVFSEITIGLNTLIAKLSSTAEGIDSVIYEIRKGKGSAAAFLSERALYDTLRLAASNLSYAIIQAKIGLERFSENMEALKHNWLFKKYFEQKGYWKEGSESEQEKNFKEISKYKKQIDSLTIELEKLKKAYETKYENITNE